MIVRCEYAVMIQSLTLVVEAEVLARELKNAGVLRMMGHEMYDTVCIVFLLPSEVLPRLLSVSGSLF